MRKVTRCYHSVLSPVPLDRSATLEHAVSALTRIGLVPVFQEMRKSVLDRLRWLNLPIDPSLIGPSDVEVLVSSDHDFAVLVKLGAGRRETRTREETTNVVVEALDLMLISETDLDDPIQRIKAAVPFELMAYSLEEALIIELFQEYVGRPSPNGKMLAEPAFRELVRRLYDDQLRHRLSLIVATFQDTLVTLSALGQLEPFGKDVRALHIMLQDPDLVSTHYTVHCRECDILHLAFVSQAEAEALVTDLKGKCASCNRQKLEIVETYAIAEPILRGIRQGLWLEALASDVVASRTDAVWTGQMIGTNEVDVMGVVGGRAILVECKDTSFGQNDLYVTFVKAQQLQADTVIIVSTRDIHPNVYENIERMRRDTRDRDFHVVTDPSASVIQKKLTDIVDALCEKQLASWFAGRSQVAYTRTRRLRIPGA